MHIYILYIYTHKHIHTHTHTHTHDIRTEHACRRTHRHARFLRHTHIYTHVAIYRFRYAIVLSIISDRPYCGARYRLSYAYTYIYVYTYTYTYTHMDTHRQEKHGTRIRTQHVSFVISSTFIHIISSLNDSATGLSKGSSRGSVDQVRYRQRVQARLTRASLALSPADRQKASPYSRSVKETVHAGGNTSGSIARYRRAFFWTPTYT